MKPSSWNRAIAHRINAGIVSAVFMAALIATSSAHAQDTKPALPSGDQVLAKYEAFLGGHAALAKITSRTTRTRRLEYSATPSDAVLVRYSKQPGLSIMHHEALDGTFIRYMNGCDATGPWVGYGRNEDGSPQPGKASTDGNCQQEQFYYGYLPLDLAKLKTDVKTLEVKAKIQIVPAEPSAAGALAGGKGPDLIPPGVRDVYLVLSTPAQATDEYVWMYFDVKTGALLRRADAGKGPVTVQPGMNPRYTDFIQYREVGDGTRAPFQFVTTSPASQVRGINTSIMDNMPLADDLFSRPKNVGREDKGF